MGGKINCKTYPCDENFCYLACSFAASVCCAFLQGGATCLSAVRAAKKVLSVYGLSGARIQVCLFKVYIYIELYGQTKVRLNRAYSRGNDLGLLEKCASIIRSAKRGLPLAESERRAAIILRARTPACTPVGALACAAFSLFFGGGAADFVIAYISGLISLILCSLPCRGIPLFLRTLFISAAGGAECRLLCAACGLLGIACSLPLSLLGNTMALIPGLGMFSAICDILSFRFLCGVRGILCALSTAIAISCGYALSSAALSFLQINSVALQHSVFFSFAAAYIGCIAGVAGFCTILRVPRNFVPYCIVCAVIAFHLSGIICASEYLSAAVAAAFACAAAYALGRSFSAREECFSVPSLVPLIPGASLYGAFECLLAADILGAFYYFCSCFAVLFAVACGTMLIKLFKEVVLAAINAASKYKIKSQRTENF